MKPKTKNLCDQCVHKNQKPCFNPCVDCDHRVNKVEYRNNFEPKKSAFRKWESELPKYYNHDNRLDIFRGRKEGWNAFAEKLKTWAHYCISCGGKSVNFDKLVRYIEDLKEP